MGRKASYFYALNIHSLGMGWPSSQGKSKMGEREYTKKRREICNF